MAAKKPARMQSARKGAATKAPKAVARRCGLCGATKRLMRTECCDQWICDDEDSYVLFSFAATSCARNHRRHTLCGSHHAEEHEGRWQDCAACRKNFLTELYVHFGTNEYNFEVLQNPPSFEPTKCARCQRVIQLSTEGFAIAGDDYLCEDCMHASRSSRKS